MKPKEKRLRKKTQKQKTRKEKVKKKQQQKRIWRMKERQKKATEWKQWTEMRKVEVKKQEYSKALQRGEETPQDMRDMLPEDEEECFCGTRYIDDEVIEPEDERWSEAESRVFKDCCKSLLDKMADSGMPLQIGEFKYAGDEDDREKQDES